jgi:hypothetical protein
VCLCLSGGPAGHVALDVPRTGEKTVKHCGPVAVDGESEPENEVESVGDDAAEAGGVTQIVGSGMMCAYITSSGFGRAHLSLSSSLSAFNLRSEYGQGSSAGAGDGEYGGGGEASRGSLSFMVLTKSRYDGESREWLEGWQDRLA